MSVDEPCDRMIMEYMSPGGHGLISIGHQGNVSGNEEGTAGRGKKKRKKRRLKVHGISYNLCECHILWASAVFGGDQLALLFLGPSFVIHIFIPHSTFGQFFI